MPTQHMDVLIVGAGAMGRWFGRYVEHPAYADVNPDAANAAATATRGTSVPVTTTDQYDLVCIAVPMPTAADAIETHAPNAARGLIDVTGVMGAPVRAMNDHAPDIERLSIHPLFAPENAPGRIATVHIASGPLTRTITDRLEAAGNTLFETTPEGHDRAMETVQAKAHTAILAFALAADEVPPEFGTPVYDAMVGLVEEVTGGTPRVYADIQETFQGADAIADAAATLAGADRETFERLYEQASE